MIVMTGVMISISLLIIVTVGVALYKYFSKNKIVEHYYTPLDHIFGQTQIEHHEEKVDKKEMDEDESDDKE
ncbi:DUF3951 domain-containing protein [Brevibacillus sp. SYSU BS000544]|uniref:DUF3951 domain-containing protein n=1 Tax=Brevibacillus sp. SYSU BS000544 TaxID=3416443 RepID=UPI003CE5228B